MMNHNWEISQLLQRYYQARKDAEIAPWEKRHRIDIAYAKVIQLQSEQNCGFIMLLNDFIDYVRCDLLSDCDGCGYFLDEGGNSHEPVKCSVEWLKKIKVPICSVVQQVMGETTMSDYERTKAVFYPIDEDMVAELKEKYDWFHEAGDISYIGLKDEPLDKYFQCNKLDRVYADGYFDTESFYNYSGDHKTRCYLIFVLFSTYGEGCEDFGRQRPLTDTEKVKYTARFSEILPNIVPDKLKLLDYCYYNCSDCDDYYLEDANKHDEFYDEV